ncbi:MAG: hypothetical protein RIR16_34 [Actinomycetota bacterium]
MRPRPTARSVALDLLEAVEFDDAYANLVLPKLLQRAELPTRDAALAQELAFGTLRWQLFYDRVIEECARRYSDEIDLEVLLILRLGVHQLLATRIPPHAALSETVELAKTRLKPSAIGFINGVLRRSSERDRVEWLEIVLRGISDRHERLAIQYSHPIWVVAALEQALALDNAQHELEDLLAADNVPAKVSMVALPGFAPDTSELQPGLHSPLAFSLDAGDPGRFESVRLGQIRVQDEGSQLAALALTSAEPVSENEQWLDMCAGPGGKAALLAAVAVQSGVSLTCNEVSEHRTKLVRQALRPIRGNISVKTGDGRKIGAAEPEKYDRIMLDAPCTGLGALRRRPEARWRKSVGDLGDLTRLQTELIDSAWKALKPGGILAYVTCSPHPAETVGQINSLLKQQPKAELLSAPEVLVKFAKNLGLKTDRKTAQLWPHRDFTDAMFISLIRKPIA